MINRMYFILKGNRVRIITLQQCDTVQSTKNTFMIHDSCIDTIHSFYFIFHYIVLHFITYYTFIQINRSSVLIVCFITAIAHCYWWVRLNLSIIFIIKCNVMNRRAFKAYSFILLWFVYRIDASPDHTSADSIHLMHTDITDFVEKNLMSVFKNITFSGFFVLRLKQYLGEFVDHLFVFVLIHFVSFHSTDKLTAPHFGKSAKATKKKNNLKTELCVCVNIFRQNVFSHLRSFVDEHRALHTKHLWGNVVFISIEIRAANG